MTSTQDENGEPQGDFGPHETESNIVDARPVRCFPTVKRSFRQKQCNWRWRWKYFTRALQPILEQGENARDDTSKVDGKSTDLPEGADDRDENELASSTNCEADCLEPKHREIVNLKEGDDFHEEPVSITAKDDYSACIQLIEKFQEAVLENAVRVIQAAFKRFRERRRFLKLRNAATVIQRSVRQWLKRKHSSERLKCYLAIKGNCEQSHEVLRNCPSSFHDFDTEDVIGDGEGNTLNNQNETADENHDGLESFSSVDHDNLTEDKDGISQEASEEADQFENSLLGLDLSSFRGSTDNISDAGVWMEPCEDICPIVDPDSLSLADSGIDTHSVTSVEATITDECKFSSCENPSLASSPNALIDESPPQ